MLAPVVDADRGAKSFISIIYETHSPTTDNDRGLATGWNEGALSAAGLVAARAIGSRRRHDHVTAVYSSDLFRAAETASLAFADSNIPVFFDSRLRECNYGALNGARTQLVFRDRTRNVHERYPGGESYLDVAHRMAAFLEVLASKPRKGRILLLSHSAPKWALDYLLLRVPLETSVLSPFRWQPGWAYTVPVGWQATKTSRE